MLGVTQNEFISKAVSTRIWYSHLLSENNKKDRLKEGSDMVVYFAIIFYAIRLYIAEKINVIIEEKYIMEYLYTVHDWVVIIKSKTNEPNKSNRYKIDEMYNTLNKAVSYKEV